jgi:hypothetical protein
MGLNYWKHSCVPQWRGPFRNLTIFRNSVICILWEIVFDFWFPCQDLFCQHILLVQEQDDGNGPQPPGKEQGTQSQVCCCVWCLRVPGLGAARWTALPSTRACIWSPAPTLKKRNKKKERKKWWSHCHFPEMFRLKIDTPVFPSYLQAMTSKHWWLI